VIGIALLPLASRMLDEADRAARARHPDAAAFGGVGRAPATAA